MNDLSHENLGTSDAPSLCHICVVSPTRQIDIALPDTVPLILLMPRLVELTAADTGSGSGRQHGSGWTVARIGGEPLDHNHSLGRLGIRNGEMLLLSPAEEAPPSVLSDDVIDAVASYASSESSIWATGRTLPITCLMLILTALVAAAAMLGAPAGTHLALASIVLLAIPALITLALLGKRSRSPWATTSLLIATVPLVAGALGQLIPGDPGAPHALVAAIYTLCLMIIAARQAPETAHIQTSLAAIAAVVALGTILLMIAPMAPVHAAMACLAASPFAAALAPRLAMALARLPLPPVPSPGMSLSLADPAGDAPGATSHPATATADVESRTVVAYRYLDGLLAAVLALSAGAAAMTAFHLASTDDPHGYAELALLAVIASAFLLRGRGIARTAPAVIIASTGALVAAAAMLGAAWSPLVPTTAVVAVALVMLLGTFIIGVVLPGGTYTPVQYRLVELLEYLMLALAVPAGLWALDLFSYVRGL
ncbi:type VII secretion integral membrane protein EccD [Lolliginicoccus suaedae]|uniref:type VII secretion integral membrane protein EccD n=1 Tax=Lolliginicoccus suaedae TaxID=2605429 RepID=UPI001659B5B7|nr:type VII secretion integral membrane protein EccD [Lolliginicoccus suaedae]